MQYDSSKQIIEARASAHIIEEEKKEEVKIDDSEEGNILEDS